MNEVTIKRKTGIALFGSNGVEINLKTLSSNTSIRFYSASIIFPYARPSQK